MPGFGREPFGRHPFGRANYGADTVVRVFPKTTLEKDTKGYLSRYLITVQNSANKRREEIDGMIDFVDPDRIRSDILNNLGASIGLELDENEPVEFRRTLVRDAVQYYQIKGTAKSYSIRGLISGFDVEVVKIWEFDPMYLSEIPVNNRYEYPPGSGTVSGIWYTDLSPDMVSGVSATVPREGDCTYCLTSYIKVNYTLVKLPTQAIVGNLLDRVIRKIREVIPIHVRDLFIDLTVYIEVDVNGQMCVFADELANVSVGALNRYDIVAADVITTDTHIPNVVVI